MTDKAAIPDAWSPFGKPRGTRDPELNIDARAQAFLDRIAPLSADLAAHGHTRARALQKLRRICQAEVRRLKERLTPATVKLYLSKYRDAIRQIDPDHLVLRPRKMRSGQRFSYLALPPEETRALNAAYHQRIHEDQSNLIPLDPQAFIEKAIDLLASGRYLEKGMGLMALTGRRPAEIFFSANFSLPPKKLPFPALIFDGQLKTRHAPRHKLRALPYSRSGRSKKDHRRARSTPGPENLRERRCRQHHHRPWSCLSTSPPPSALWTNPGNRATSAAPTEPSAATSSNPETRPTTSSWPRSSAISCSGLTHRFRWGNPIRISLSCEN